MQGDARWMPSHRPLLRTKVAAVHWSRDVALLDRALRPRSVHADLGKRVSTLQPLGGGSDDSTRIAGDVFVVVAGVPTGVSLPQSEGKRVMSRDCEQ